MVRIETAVFQAFIVWTRERFGAVSYRAFEKRFEQHWPYRGDGRVTKKQLRVMLINQRRKNGVINARSDSSEIVIDKRRITKQLRSVVHEIERQYLQKNNDQFREEEENRKEKYGDDVWRILGLE